MSGRPIGNGYNIISADVGWPEWYGTFPLKGVRQVCDGLGMGGIRAGRVIVGVNIGSQRHLPALLIGALYTVHPLNSRVDGTLQIPTTLSVAIFLPPADIEPKRPDS